MSLNLKLADVVLAQLLGRADGMRWAVRSHWVVVTNECSFYLLKTGSNTLNVAQQHMNGDSNAQHEYFMNAQKHDKDAQHFLAMAQA